MPVTEKSKISEEIQNSLKQLQKEGLVGRVVPLKGLLISDNGEAKIYTDATFSNWIELSANDIKMTLPISAHKAAIDGEQLIYVEKGAELVYTQIKTTITTAGGIKPLWTCTCTDSSGKEHTVSHGACPGGTMDQCDCSNPSSPVASCV